MKLIQDKNFSSERALYAVSDAIVERCTFAGAEDGESAFKEAKNIRVSECTFELRYPFWHTTGYAISDSTMTETCRAALWYANDGKLERVTVNGPKALRECDNCVLSDVTARSAEFGWRCRTVSADSCTFESEYIFFQSERLCLKNVTLSGKYSFQYVNGLKVKNCNFDTKDSFWHAKNVLVEDSVIKGEYLGWYSDSLTMRNCKIIGTQPFCYCTNLVLENCELIDCDLAFEYSDVEADVRGHIVSVKNPKSGYITADSIGEIIKGDAVYPCDCEIKIR